MNEAVHHQIVVGATLVAYAVGISLWVLCLALAKGFWRRSRLALKQQRTWWALPRLVLAGILCTGLLVMTIGGLGIAALTYTDDQEYDGDCGC